MLRSVVNIGKLIEEVKKRPLLYDCGQNTWVQNKKRNAAWEEIAEEIFKEIWEPSDHPKKEALIRELQTKWKSIRNAYQRFCKQSKEDRLTGKLRKPYIYAELLAFLDKDKDSNLNAVYLEEASGNDDIDEDDDNNDHDDGDNSMDYMENSNPLNSGGDEATDNEATVPVAATSTTVTSPMTTATTLITTTTAETTATTSLLDRNLEKIGGCLQQLLVMQREDHSDDKMGNKKFLLSLLPFMEHLPEDVNLEVRLQLMSVIQTYSNGESFMKM